MQLCLTNSESQLYIYFYKVHVGHRVKQKTFHSAQLSIGGRGDDDDDDNEMDNEN